MTAYLKQRERNVTYEKMSYILQPVLLPTSCHREVSIILFNSSYYSNLRVSAKLDWIKKLNQQFTSVQSFLFLLVAVMDCWTDDIPASASSFPFASP